LTPGNILIEEAGIALDNSVAGNPARGYYELFRPPKKPLPQHFWHSSVVL
jgi:hypothetical protein